VRASSSPAQPAMGSVGAHASQGALTPRAGRCRGLRTALLLAVGALLLTTASVRLSPYARTRMQTARLISAMTGIPLVEPAPAPASPIEGLASDRLAAQAVAGDQGDAETGDAARPDLASVALVPTPVALPTRLVIPAISVDARIVPISQRLVKEDGASLAVPRVPTRYAAGWHDGSAALGVPGNTVLSGHNAGYGEVFRDLYLLKAGNTPYLHTVSEVILLREEGRTVEARRRNARYVEQTSDERLTLVTCHPYGSLRYRLIVVAHPRISSTGLTARRALSED